MRVNYKQMTLNDFYVKVIKKVKVLRTFQRKICWSDSQRKKFITSVFEGRALGAIVLVDLTEVVEHLRIKGMKEEMKFFQDLLDRGYRYISIDGQNRTQAILEFIENLFTITGDFTDKDGQHHSITNKYYKDLPARLKDVFNDRLTLLTLIEAMDSRHEMHYTFTDLNSGEPLNEQEKRNALLTIMAKWIRDLSEEQTISKIWEASLTMKDDSIAASADAALTAKLYMALAREKDSINTSMSRRRLDDASIDEFYNIGVQNSMPENVCAGYKESERQRVEKILKKVANILSSAKVGKSTLADRTLWAIVLVTAWVIDSPNYHFQPGKLVDFCRIVTETDRDLVERAEIQFGKDLDQWYRSGKASKKPKSSSYYKHKASNVKNPTARKERFNQLMQRLLSDQNFISTVRSLATSNDVLRVSNG